MAWQAILTDLNGNVHGEINESDERKVGLQHMRVPSASFKLPLSHYLADTILSTDTLIKCYRYDEPTAVKTLAFNGPVVSAEESSDGSSQGIAVVAAGPFWRTTKRYIGKTKAGFALGIPTPIDLGLAAHTILDTINGEDFTGIGKGSRSAVTTGGFGPWHLRSVAEGIAELTSGLNSFEFVVDPQEPVGIGGVGGWPQIGSMRIASSIGSLKPDAIFEYGTDYPNVSGYTRAITREGMITRGIMSVSGWPETPAQQSPGPPPIPSDLMITNASTLAARGLFEDILPDANIVTDSVRQTLSDFHILYRKNPREIITFNPALNARPTPLVDYMPGDTVRARAVVSGNVRFDALFRIWGVTFNIDQAGNEQIELELVRP